MDHSAYIIEGPSKAQQDAMRNKVISGQIRQEYGDTTSGKYLFQTGLTASELEDAIIFKQINESNRFFMQQYGSFFEKRNVATIDRIFSWMTQDRPNIGTNVSSVVTAGGAFPVTSVVFLSDVRPVPVRRVTELLRLNNKTYIITAVSIDGGTGRERITMSRLNGANIIAGEIAPTQVLGYGGNAQREGSGAIAPSSFQLPDDNSNYTQIIRESMEYTGDVAARRTFVNFKGINSSGKFENYLLQYEENEMIRNFAIAKEAAIAWGEGLNVEPLTTRGIFPDIMANSTWRMEYTGTPTETNFQDFMEAADLLYDTKKHVGLFGRALFKSFGNIFGHYLDEGARSFGQFEVDVFKAVGLNINAYNFQGRQIVAQEYSPLSDVQVTGQNATGVSVGAGIYDHNWTAFFVNYGESAGRNADGSATNVPYVSFRYNKLGSVDRSVVVGFVKGLTGEDNQGNPAISIDNNGALKTRIRSNQIVSPVDASSCHMLGTVGVQLVLPDIAHGLMLRIG